MKIHITLLVAILFVLISAFESGEVRAESSIDLLASQDLSLFQTMKSKGGENDQDDRWRYVKDAKANDRNLVLVAAKGKDDSRYLVNGSTKLKTPYLITRENFKDIKLEFEFMIPAKSNAGIYFMGRYEIQILDSFGKTKLKHGDMGGIYEHWDDSKPKGEQGFGGTPPKVNACKSPGEWQRYEIIFRAPKFDESGKKISKAKFEKVVLNDHLLHENVEVDEPTRGPMKKNEVVEGPLRIQGDHGPIAIRRYVVTRLD